MLLNDFAQRLKRKKVPITDIYFTYFDAASITPDIVVNSHAKVNKEELGSLSKSERQKLQRLYTQGFAAYGSMRNLAKAAKNSLSKVRDFLQSKTSYTRFTQAKRKSKEWERLRDSKDEFWCMDLAYVDKLAKDNDGVKF